MEEQLMPGEMVWLSTGSYQSLLLFLEVLNAVWKTSALLGCIGGVDVIPVPGAVSVLLWC